MLQMTLRRPRTKAINTRSSLVTGKIGPLLRDSRDLDIPEKWSNTVADTIE